MKTKKLMALVVIAISAFVSCDDDDTFGGSGNLISEERTIESFTKIESSGVFEINITQDPVQKVVVTADDNIVGNVKTTVSNGTLRVYLKDGNYKNINTSLDISVNQLTKVLNEGSGFIEANGFTNNLLVEIENSGSGSIFYEGSTNELQIENEGSGEVDCMDLISNSARVDIEGSGDCYINVENQLKGKIEGSGSIYYQGSPVVEMDIEGSGKVVKIN